jgi:three-Cys-motif partner protein
MKGKSWPLIYFDGFAGSGEIQTDDETEAVIEGTAKQVLSFAEPREFDIYYFVEKSISHASYLQGIINREFSEKRHRCSVIGGGDCNQKLLDLAGFLKSNRGKNHKAIAFIDPYGMQVKWPSLEALKGLGVDLWILVPTGIGINRLLRKNEKSEKVWFQVLSEFFGLEPEDIEKRFYIEDPQQSLFDEARFIKIENAVDVAADLYVDQLKTIWKHVSKPLPLRNSTNAVLFHFIAASNAAVAVRIANDIIKKES